MPGPATIEGATFQARARTVDHLGREQIADCPTAVSELWKNAFDAYARRVELNIYDGSPPVASITDDGHGMNRSEFLARWLVVGTESKATDTPTPVADRNGIPVRPRQGQKGIGRLSCANLGPILLLVSKRALEPFVAALVDWRLFENPFINLSDVFIPVAEFSDGHELFERLPILITRLADNITGGPDIQPTAPGTPPQHAAASTRQQRRPAWDRRPKLASKIQTAINSLSFEPRHLQQWPVWTGESDHGTALLISHLNYDLNVYLDDVSGDPSASATHERFVETLISFVDPFVDPAHPDANARAPHFSYVVRVWEADAPREILGTHKQLHKPLLDQLEHRLEGRVDSSGVFSGRVKAFGEWLPSPCIVHPPTDLRIPRHATAALGPFEIYIASMEFSAANTTHTSAEFQVYRDLAAKYSGFMVFRDGLRVLPYGRTDNDFFEIESRRSKNAGREFWNHRKMFGRLAITRQYNPNLKDKTGREGLLDNRAAKTLKALVANILKQSARRYFGSESQIRNDLLPQISADNARKRAAESRKKLRQRQRRAFRAKLRRCSGELPQLARDIEEYHERLTLETESQIPETYRTIGEFRDRLADYNLSPAPKELGPLEDEYADYRHTFRALQNAVGSLADDVEQRVEAIPFKQPKPLLQRQFDDQAADVHRRLREWRRSVDDLLQTERRRMDQIAQTRYRHFHTEAEPLLRRFEIGDLTYVQVSQLLDLLKRRTDEDNADLFSPYIAALESLRDNIDLEQLAVFQMEDDGELRRELDRLNGLAQLGIAVEILGHELESYDDLLGNGLNRLPDDVRNSAAAKNIESAYEGLTDQLRFLSPLRLAGQKVQRWITGEEIEEYVRRFFTAIFKRSRITLVVTEEFRGLRVFDQRSRLYPVFINLVNNSVYWLSTGEDAERTIAFAGVGSEVIVSDNGPGVAAEDVEQLFRLFFTRKLRGGRGVGLYLCRANLAAGGHRIRYEPSAANMPLSGANFVITFRGVNFDGK